MRKCTVRESTFAVYSRLLLMYNVHLQCLLWVVALCRLMSSHITLVRGQSCRPTGTHLREQAIKPSCESERLSSTRLKMLHWCFVCHTL